MIISKKKLTNRIFRADTPHDVFCAAIVARRLPPGNDVLAVNTDYNKDEKQSGDYLECMLMAASVHAWKEVVNISGLPVNQFHKTPAITLSAKLNRVKDTIDSIRQLRQLLASPFGITPDSSFIANELQFSVDEIYLNTIQHAEVQAFYKIFPDKRKIHIPHGFDSLQKTEILAYNEFLNYKKRDITAFFLDTLKKIIFGEDGVPMRRMQFDASYSFNFPFPKLAEQYVIKQDLNPDLMRSLYENLTAEVHNYFSALAAEGVGKIGILLTQAEDHTENYPQKVEINGYTKLIKALISLEEVETILIKPHPRTGRGWLEQVVLHIRKHFPEINILVIENFRYLPIEVVLSAFENVVACAGIASSAMRSLKTVYGLRTYYLKNILFDLYENCPQFLELYREWLCEVEGEFIPIDNKN